MNEEYLDKVSKQKQAYNELDKFVPGEGGLQYFPVPIEELKQWRKEQDRKDMEEYEKRELEKQNNSVLELREEKPRGNGHNDPFDKVTFVEETVTDPIQPSAEYTKPNPDHCELKKKPTKKRVSKKK